MRLEEMLAEIAPQPTDEDAGDMLNVALAVNNVLTRRCDRLEGELAEARDKLTKLVRVADGAPTRSPVPGPRKAAAVAARIKPSVTAELVDPEEDGEGA